MRGIFRSLGEGEDRNVVADNPVDPSASATVITAADLVRPSIPLVSVSKPSELTSEGVSVVSPSTPEQVPILLTTTPPVPAAVDPSLPVPVAAPAAAAPLVTISSSFPVGLAVIAGLLVVAGGIYYFGKKK